MALCATNNREENTPAAIFRDRRPCRARHHQLMKNPLGWDRILCRGEFGAAVFEQRHSIRSRLAGKVFSGIEKYACGNCSRQMPVGE